MSGAIAMDKFEDAPQPLYSLLMDMTPCMFPCHIFADDEWPLNFVRTFEITTTPSHSAPLASNKIYPFMALKECTLFVFKVNCVIASAPFFHLQVRNLPFPRSTSTVQILWNKCNIACLTITIYSMPPSFTLFKECFNNQILISKCF